MDVDILTQPPSAPRTIKPLKRLPKALVQRFNESLCNNKMFKLPSFPEPSIATFNSEDVNGFKEIRGCIDI